MVGWVKTNPSKIRICLRRIRAQRATNGVVEDDSMDDAKDRVWAKLDSIVDIRIAKNINQKKSCSVRNLDDAMGVTRGGVWENLSMVILNGDIEVSNKTC